MAQGLRALGYDVWLDEALPAHRVFEKVIKEHLSAAKAVVVIWSAEAAKSDWVRSEANRAREARKLVQLTIDDAPLPMPFDQIHCADMKGWTGDAELGGLAKGRRQHRRSDRQSAQRRRQRRIDAPSARTPSACCRSST